MHVIPREISLTDVVATLCRTCGDLKPDRDAEHHHVTELVRAALRLAKGQPAVRAAGEPDEFAGLVGVADMGELWEAVAANYIRSTRDSTATFLPKLQMQRDGVVGNLDGLWIDADGELVVVEMKMRNTSKMESPTEHPAWLMQGLAYCHLTGARMVSWVVLYAGSKPPSFRVVEYMVQVEDTDVVNNWGVLMATKKYLETTGGTNDRPY